MKASKTTQGYKVQFTKKGLKYNYTTCMSEEINPGHLGGGIYTSEDAANIEIKVRKVQDTIQKMYKAECDLYNTIHKLGSLKGDVHDFISNCKA